MHILGCIVSFNKYIPGYDVKCQLSKKVCKTTTEGYKRRRKI